MPNLHQHYLEEELIKNLQDRENLLGFIDQSLDGMWFWDLENPEEEWISPQFWKTLGYNPEEMEHKASAWQDLIHPDDFKQVKKNLEEHIENPEHPYDQVVRYFHKDGSTIWIRCRGIAIRDENNKATRMLGTHVNVSDFKLLEQRHKNSLLAIDKLYAKTKLALDESEQLFEASPDALIQVDQDGFITKSNILATRIFGYSKDEFLQKRIEDLIPSGARANHTQHRKAYFDSPTTREMGQAPSKLKGLRKDGSIFPVDIRLSPIPSRFGTQVIAAVRDISEKVKMQSELLESQVNNRVLYEKSIKDPLTELFNRRYFFEQGQQLLTMALAQREPVSVMMMDIDDFKAINDTYGHDKGDDVLKLVANFVSKNLRKHDICCRVGGEEFAAILPNSDDIETLAIADRITFSLPEHAEQKLDNAPLKITISIGITTINPTAKSSDPIEIATLFKQADEALYLAKTRGKNRSIPFREVEQT